MTTYYCTRLILSGFPYDVESWVKGNHMTIYSGGTQIFDGYALGGYQVEKQEVEKLVKVAKENGLAVEVIEGYKKGKAGA